MQKSELEHFLQASLSDDRLDNLEKRELRDSLQALAIEDRNFVRNRAFDLARDAIINDASRTAPIMQWLQKIVKLCQLNQEFAQADKVFFSPGDRCRQAIIEALENAQLAIDIYVFTISDDRISRAILAAHQRGVKVRVISDNDKAHDLGSDIEQLSGAGVALRVDHSPNHMHHKFALFDQRLLINGSFNWTRSASTRNQENIVLSYEPDLLRSFGELFEQLWQRYQ